MRVGHARTGTPTSLLCGAMLHRHPSLRLRVASSSGEAEHSLSSLARPSLALCRGLASRRRRRHGRPSKAPRAAPSCSTHPPAPSKAEHRAAIAHACGRSRCCPYASPSSVEPSSAAACRLPCCGHTWTGCHGPPLASLSASTGAGGHVGARAAFLRRRSPPAQRHRQRGHH
jgi:hypothetical protein